MACNRLGGLGERVIGFCESTVSLKDRPLEKEFDPDENHSLGKE